MPLRTLKDLDYAGKTVFYRPDYNVPMKDGVIADDFRIRASLPTLEALLAAGCRVVLGTHMGRPDGKRVPGLELRPVAERLADLLPGRDVRLAQEIDHAEVRAAAAGMPEGSVLMLPNLRFYAGEEANDPAFAALLTGLAEVYVNDAFACDHRAHASIVGPPATLPAAAGYLVEKEVANLGGLIGAPASPFVVVMGGAKVSDKIEVIRSLAAKADLLLIGGAMANTFLLARGDDVSESKAEADKVGLATELAAELGGKLLLAPDYVKEQLEGGAFRYMDIGPEAVELFSAKLREAKTIFWNGSLGYTEDERFAGASRAVAHVIAESPAVSVIAGGDTVEMISREGLGDKMTFISTGGGAALELLAGQTLPGIVALQA